MGGDSNPQVLTLRIVPIGIIAGTARRESTQKRPVLCQDYYARCSVNALLNSCRAKTRAGVAREGRRDRQDHARAQGSSLESGSVQ